MECALPTKIVSDKPGQGVSPSDPLVGGAAPLAVALIIGFVGVAFIAFFTHWYETVLCQQQENQQLTNLSLPPLVVFMVFMLLLCVNPVLRAITPNLQLRRRELFVLLSMWLLTAAVTYLSFMNPIVVLAGEMMGPGLDNPAMKRVEFKEALPANLFLDRDASALFYYGKGDVRLPLSAVPWLAWLKPMVYWVPFMLVVLVLSAALVGIVQRQWSRHELIAFPIADVQGFLLEQKPHRAFPEIFHQKLFWYGFGMVAFIFLLNGLSVWFPLMPDIRLQFWYSDLVFEFTFLSKYCCNFAFSLFRLLVHPYMVALAVLLPLELSFTCWFGWILMIAFTGVNFLFTGDAFTEAGSGHWQAGSYFGIFLFILVVGWREYAAIAYHAFTFRRSEDPELRRAAWAGRIFVLAFAGLVGMLMLAGLDWILALLIALAFVLMSLMIMRLTAELGMPYLGNFWHIVRFIPLNMLGAAAVGPKNLALFSTMSAPFDTMPANTPVANETTYRKLQEGQRRGLPGWSFNAILLATAIIAIACATVAHLWDDYSFGARREQVMRVYLIKYVVNNTTPLMSRLQAEGKAEELNSASGLGRLRHAKSEPRFWRYFMYGFIGVCLFGFMRLRFTWWPLHPLPLLFFNTWAMSRFFFCFFLGWLIKLALAKIGGGETYVKSKPFFVGMIVGQMVTLTIWVIVGAIYFAITGTPPSNWIGYI
jgi:hypothetical protein